MALNIMVGKVKEMSWYSSVTQLASPDNLRRASILKGGSFQNYEQAWKYPN